MKQRLMSLILIVLILLPSMGYPSYGKDYVKEVDGGFNNIQIHIQGKKISNHKEAFIYDDSIWVPLKDLSRGLNLSFNMDRNKKRVQLNSNGRLKVDGTNSKEIRVFQRGYEIEAKERIIKDLEGKSSASTKGRQPTVRNIKVALSNWVVFLDGKKLNLEPLYYNEDLYVDIMSIAPYLYITPNYKNDRAILDIDANGILVKDSQYANIDNLLAFREGRNYLLDIQMEQLQKRIELENSLRGIPYAKINNIQALQEYLNKNFEKVGDLVVDINVRDTIGKWIYLDIDFSRSQFSKWYKLQRKEVEDWIWDMYTAILNLYDEEALLHGAIRNPYSSRYSSSSYKNYVTFDTKDMDLYFDFSRSLLKKDYRFDPNHLVDALNKTLNRYNQVNFKYEISLSGDDIDLIVYPDSNLANGWSLYNKMGYLKRLNWEIRRVYPELNVNGTLIFPKENTEPIKFYFDNNRIRSYDLLRETEVHLNNLYGSLSYGSYSYGIDFNIYEKDIDNLKLIVEGDFSTNDDKWINGGTTIVDRLNTRVQNAISTLISLWDMNISTEVIDKNGVTITEIDTYQKNVGIVYANPSEGIVKEGTLVYLYTDTPGADIYYTLDGSTPTRQSYRYTEPIVVSRDLTINAFGYKEGMGSGPITSLEYTIVPDDDWSYGLRNLKIDRGTLSPSFSRDILNYEVNIDGNTKNITVTPYANDGDITVNGQRVSSGEGRTISLKEGRNIVTISVKEKDKRERVYTLTIYKGSSGTTDIRIDRLHFSTTIVGVFKGQLTSNYISNFSGYKVELLSKAGVKYKEVYANSSGNFEITGFEIDAISKIIGYKYRVYDGAGNLVLENDL